MSIVYNGILIVIGFLLKLIALFNPKIKLFVAGRKESFNRIKAGLNKNDDVLWMHAASLGEYEQGLPILEALKKTYPNYKILLTFFSPSGYEVKKDKTPADVVAYLPLDTRANARKILRLIQPKAVLFVKYEVWPSLMTALKKSDIPTLLVSGIFSERQVYFKWYGGFLKNALKKFDYYYVQDENSKNLLASIGITNVTVGGDSRFDRVTQILESDTTLSFMDAFLQDHPCIVAGSTWPPDEELLTTFINKDISDYKYVLAPHTLKPAHISKIEAQLKVPTVRYSNLKNTDVSKAKVIILDTIGLLTKVYSYATIAYVGGAFGTGLHNTLEPAVFGIPVLIGPDYIDFIEAKALVKKGGILSINNQGELNDKLSQLQTQKQEQKRLGKLNASYIQNQKGATEKVMNHLKGLL
ncbi:3-deoxy-D-manno-octulosonic acid transferase [Flavobacterium sp. ASW18X]|uniref:3-deoxy-D-manno-octulosonic acid transferase n=1 Tax=Flavobacterium sp. ASW18X TaxID=2572595 RepID=UPI0010ADC3D9|nr:glycosyltransferase N-terminal domain-containing protein [Flavobacterium sp. ASW18X]TKD66576.1 3-deoxy-D-manno-octulosonic acid transferase [Flavobacterium sp. ASW18X]